MDDKLNMQQLEIMSEYNMTPDEVAAYKLCCSYELIAHKVFPHYRHYKTGKRGDPRKSALFKYCYKMINDTRGKLDPKEYSLYIKAQMDVFKAIGEGGESPLVQPSCLVGEKAWKRWLVWKKHYEIKKSKFKSAEEVVKLHPLPAVEHQLKQTKQFLDKRLNTATPEKIRQSLEDKRMLLWVNTQQVSGYYVVASPTINSWLGEKGLDYKMFSVDIGYYKPGVTELVMEKFKNEIE